MVDQIFSDIMKEARSRKGNDLIPKIYSVYMELGLRTLAAMEGIREEERRQQRDRQDL